MPLMLDKLSQLWRRLLFYLRRDRFDRDLEEEMRFHLELKTKENAESGMKPEEARYAARRQFGNQTLLLEVSRDMWSFRFLETLTQDLRYGLRMMVKNPGFTAVVALTLALGIGANTAIFTVINTMLLRSLPVKNPGELVQVVVTSASDQSQYNAFSYPLYEQLRDGGQSLSGLFAAGRVEQNNRLRVVGGGDVETEFVRAQPVSGNFFSVLGVPAIFGRTFTAEDDRAGNPQAIAVISHSFWQRRFASDPSIVGQAITFRDVPMTIVGITPPDFFGFQPGENPELWWPLQMVPQVEKDPSARRLSAGAQWLCLIGRRSPGVVQRQAEAELAVIFQRYRDNQLTTRGANWSADRRERFLAQKLTLQSGRAGWTGLRDQLRLPLFILMGAVAAVLLIACANVASLLLARAAAREREFSVRNALGAGRLRLMRQLLTESLLLAGVGGLLGLLCAQGATRLLSLVMGLPSDPISLSLTPDPRVLLFTMAATLLTGLLFGLALAFRGSRIEVASALKGSCGSVAGHASRQRFHQSLIVAQVALSLMLLLGAGLFARTLKNLRGLDAGFNRENLVLFNVIFTQQPDAARWSALYKGLLARLEALPGVRASSLFDLGYLSGNGWSDHVSAEGYVAALGENLEHPGVLVGPKFFETIGIALLSGREFGLQDERPVGPPNAIAPGTAIINQTMARHYFGNANPLGRRIFFTGNPEKKFEIVGVAPDAKYWSLREQSPPTFYLPFFQAPPGSGANFALRTSGDPRATMAALAEVVREVDRTLRVRDVRTMDDVVNRTLQQERLLAQLGGFFSVFALGLACLGLYGVLSFAVAQRTREIGVRVALGAQRRDVLSLVINKGLKLALTGVVIGLAGGLALTRLVSSLLYDVTPTDPLTFVSVVMLLVIVALLACWIPARRAAKVDPMTALRSE